MWQIDAIRMVFCKSLCIMENYAFNILAGMLNAEELQNYNREIFWISGMKISKNSGEKDYGLALKVIF